MIISIVLAYAFKWLGLVDDVLLMIIIISTISLGVVVPTLKEMNIMRTTIGQFILLVAVLADLFTMVLLTVYGALNGQGGGSIWLSAILVVLPLFLYYWYSVQTYVLFTKINVRYNTNWNPCDFCINYFISSIG